MINAIGNIIGRNPQSGFSAEFQAVIARAATLGYTQPNGQDKRALDTFLRLLDTAGLFDRMKTGNIYGYGSVEFGTLNLANPLTFQHTLVNSPTFTEDSGVRSNGTTSYINTQYNVNEYVGKETDVTTIVYISESSTDIATTKNVFGARSQAASSATPYRLTPLLISNAGQRQQYGAADNFTSADHKGLYIMTYTGTASILYKDWDGTNGVKDTQVVTPATPDLANDELLLAFNSSAVSGGVTASNFYDKYVSGFFRFNRFSDADATAFKTIWDQFRVSVGLGLWLLVTSFWNDLEFWMDASTWID